MFILRFLGFFSIFQTVQFLAHSLIFFSFLLIFGINNPYTIALLAALFLAMWGGFDWAWFSIRQKNTRFASDLYLISCAWLGTVHFLVWASLFYWVLEIVSLSFGWGINARFWGKIFFLSAVAISAYGLWNSKNIYIKNYKIQIKNLPAFWAGKKAVMFADSHLGNIHGIDYVKKIIELVKGQNPDIVFVPGDFFDGPPGDFKALAEPLGSIKAPLGVYFCNGNHEEFGNSEPFVEAIKAAGVTVLNNAFMEVWGLQIVGVDYHSTRGGWNLKKVLNELTYDTQKPSILLKHVPSGLKAAESSGMALMLSGHTHRAQMWPLNFLTKIIFKGYDYGHKPYKNLQVITTSGAGTWGPPQRVGTQSEIVVIEFEGLGK